MYSALDTLVRDQGMVESDVTEGGDKTAMQFSLSWMNTTLTNMELKFCCYKAWKVQTLFWLFWFILLSLSEVKVWE